jgi:hypothetical protein
MKQVKKLLLITMFVSIAGCKDSDLHENLCQNNNNAYDNAFENATDLECGNLKIREVSFTNENDFFPESKTIVLTMENVCGLCDLSELGVYQPFYMISKISGDTIARCDCANYAAPPNKSAREYYLGSELLAIPNPNCIRFSMPGICTDIPFFPN